MKLLTYYTDSHKDLFGGCFLPSIPAEDNFDLNIGCGVQRSVDGAYTSKGFNQTTEEKIRCILSVLDTMDDDTRLLYSDCDVVFLKPVKGYLQGYSGYDMVFQEGHSEFNTGFMLMRNGSGVRALLLDVAQQCNRYKNDQDALNLLMGSHYLSYKKFDRRVLSPADFIFPCLWDGHKFPVPDSALVFHACWCVGVERKKLLLDMVKNES